MALCHRGGVRMSRGIMSMCCWLPHLIVCRVAPEVACVVGGGHCSNSAGCAYEGIIG